MGGWIKTSPTNHDGLNRGFVSGKIVLYKGEKWRVVNINNKHKDAFASFNIVNVPGETVRKDILHLPLSVVSNLPNVAE